MSDRRAFIRHGPWCPDGTWAALPFWLGLAAPVRQRLAALLGEAADFNWEEARRADPEWAPRLREAKAEGLPLFITANPGDWPPEDLLAGYTVYLLDICYADKAFAALVDEVGPEGRIIVLDHHESATKVFALHGGPTVTWLLDLSRSGAEIAWDYARERGVFAGPPSRLAAYVGDRDTWKFALPDSQEVNESLRFERVSTSLGAAERAYNRELSDPAWIPSLAREGAFYVRHRDHVVQTIAAGAAPAYVSVRAASGEVEEYKILVANSPVYTSEVGHALAERVDKDASLYAFVAVWSYKHRADEIHVSLRTNRPDVNLATIAPAVVGVLNGGGHPRASGCAIKGSDVKAVFRPHPAAKTPAVD